MTQFQELLALALDRSRRDQEHTLACERAVETVGLRLAKRLGAPNECLRYQEVHSHSDGTLGQLMTFLSSGFPSLLSSGGNDGQRHFAIWASFTSDQAGYNATVTFGVRRFENQFVFRLDAGKEFVIDPTTGVGVDEFCDHICEDFRQFFMSPIGQRATRMGFVVSR
jgi:hypothetical protein